MASNEVNQLEDFEKDALFVERFVYDVLVYTLTKCGLPESCLPTPDCPENVYRRTDFVKVAGASSLRISLIMREKWKRMFTSRRNSCGFVSKDVVKFLMKLAICCPLSRTDVTQSLVELLLALITEIMMYFHVESMDIDINIVMKSASVCIMSMIGSNQNNSEKIEELFDDFDDISEYTEWITKFIIKFAIPYGSRDDVPDLFYESVGKKFKDDLKKLKDSLLFLACDLFLAITAEESENLAKLPLIVKDNESPEAPNMNSEIGPVHGNKPLSNQPTRPENVFEISAEGKQICNVSSKLEIEHDLIKRSLDVEEASQEIHGTVTNAKTDHIEKGKKDGP